MFTTAFVGVMMAVAVSAGDEKSADDCFRFVFDAIVEGLRRDSFPSAMAKKIAGNDQDFVPKCNLCSATRKALHEYAHLGGERVQTGARSYLVRRLDSPDDAVRRDALRELVGKYIDEAFVAKKMSPAQQAAMQSAIAKERDNGMAAKPGHLEYCPSCEGGSCQVPPDESSQWGTAVDGVASRLSLVTRNPQVGRKLRLRLEVRNSGTGAAKYDDQQARVNNSLQITGPGGLAIPYIAFSFQTMGHSQQLAPHQQVTIFADLDAAEQYLLEKPGEYTLQFVGRGGIPKSNELKVTLKDGQLRELQAMVVALSKVAPPGWRVSTYGDSITLINSPTRLKRDVTSVTIFFTKTKDHGRQIGNNQPAPKYLLETNGGHAWLQPQNDNVAQLWSDFEKVITDQMKPFAKFTW